MKCGRIPRSKTLDEPVRQPRALAIGFGLAFALADGGVSAESPIEVENLQAKLVSPIGSSGNKRFLMEVELTVRGARPVPRGADIAVEASCQLDQETKRDRARLRAVQLHTLRPRQRRSFRTALFARRLLASEPKQCDILTYYLDTRSKQSVQLAMHCLRKGKTLSGSCTAKRGKKERPKLVAERSSK